jgi:hypothetical protein
LSVIDPGGHTAHAVVDTGLYCPAAHAVHVLAPVAASVLVIHPGAQAEQAAVGVALNWPATHGVHVVAPVAEPVFVTEPDVQGMQLIWALAGWYQPTAHGMQIVPDCLYFPAGHGVQRAAPLLVSVSEPAGHTEHAAVGAALYFPATQAMHVAAPLTSSVLVADPAGHTAQATVDCALKRPAAQLRQETAPAACSVFVYDPLLQSRQLVYPVPPWYRPDTQFLHCLAMAS